MRPPAEAECLSRKQALLKSPRSRPEPKHLWNGRDCREGGTFVAYFSWSGNTEHMAQIIAEQTGGSLFEIEPATPYTDDYDTLLDIARQEQSDNARPELAAQVEEWDGTLR